MDYLIHISKIEELSKEKYYKCDNNINCTPDLDVLYQAFNNINRRNLQKKEMHLPIEVPDENTNGPNNDFSDYFKMVNTIDFR